MTRPTDPGDHGDDRVGDHGDDRVGDHGDDHVGDHGDDHVGERVGDHLREALRPTAQDRVDAQRIVAGLPDRGASPARRPDVATRRRRWVGPALAAASVAALVLAAGVWRPFGPDPREAAHAPTTASPSAAADALVVTCRPGRAMTVSASRVAATSDGVHVRVENRTGASTTFTQRQSGQGATSQAYVSSLEMSSPVGEGSTDLVLDAPPGRFAVSCGGSTPADVEVVDPHAYFRGDARALVCSGTETAFDAPEQAAGRGTSPLAALHDLADKRVGRGTRLPIVELGYRDALATTGVVLLPDGSSLRAHLIFPTDGTAPNAVYTAWPDARCTTRLRLRDALAPAPARAPTTRTAAMQCQAMAQPSWAKGPGLGPTPEQAAEALTFALTGRVHAVARYAGDPAPSGQETWAMEVDGRPVVVMTVHATTAEQAAFRQGFEAVPDGICDVTGYEALMRGR